MATRANASLTKLEKKKKLYCFLCTRKKKKKLKIKIHEKFIFTVERISAIIVAMRKSVRVFVPGSFFQFVVVSKRNFCNLRVKRCCLESFELDEFLVVGISQKFGKHFLLQKINRNSFAVNRWL